MKTQHGSKFEGVNKGEKGRQLAATNYKIVLILKVQDIIKILIAQDNKICGNGFLLLMVL